MQSSPFITQLLVDWSRGNNAALAELTPHVYRELHALARSYLRRERPSATLQPTALINEVYLRLIAKPLQWENRSHFFGISARLMRLILVDHARSHRAVKRGGGSNCVTLQEGVAAAPGRSADVVEMDEALNRLAAVDARKAKVVELRYFGGLSREEIGVVMGLTVPTVKRDLRLAEAWLRCHVMGHC
jgi:RNA polymerase sigma factor (TIGR02999 family)